MQGPHFQEMTENLALEGLGGIGDPPLRNPQGEDHPFPQMIWKEGPHGGTKLIGDTHFLLEMIENMSRLEETCPGQSGTGIDLHFRGILEMEDSLPQGIWGIVH